MIATIEGRISESLPLQVVIECEGLGYEIHIPLTTMEKLPAVGQRAKLYTYIVYREDSQTAYGFHDREDREFFRLLVEKVSGIGPRIGLNMMSRMSVRMLKAAIAASDTALLSKCPGIGKKTAERLIIELKDRLPAAGYSDSTTTVTASGSEVADAADHQLPDAVNALIALGYKAPDADRTVRRAVAQLGAGATTEELIKQALS
jgi:Holliday junction DNA helicase RuvA